MTQPFTTVFAVYDNMTHLDFTGPHQVLCRLPDAQTVIASRDGGDVDGRRQPGHRPHGRSSPTSTAVICSAYPAA
jgi:putative intracellular protease/amidase